MSCLGAILSLGLSACGLGGGPSEADAVAVREALEQVPGIDVAFVNPDSSESAGLARGFAISVVSVNEEFTSDDLRRVLQALQSVFPDDYRYRIQVYIGVYNANGERESFPVKDVILDLGLSQHLSGGPSRMTFTMNDIANLRS